MVGCYDWEFVSTCVSSCALTCPHVTNLTDMHWIWFASYQNSITPRSWKHLYVHIQVRLIHTAPLFTTVCIIQNWYTSSQNPCLQSFFSGYTHTGSVGNIIIVWIIVACTEWRRECTTALCLCETILYTDKVDTCTHSMQFFTIACYCWLILLAFLTKRV